MHDDAMTGPHDRLTVSGVIRGPVSLNGDEVRWGPVSLRKTDGQIHFDATVDVAGGDEAEILQIMSRIGPAVEAAVLASCGAATNADVTGWSYPNGPLTRAVGVALRTSWDVLASIDQTPGDVRRGEEVLQAVLKNDDRRLKELYKIYHLGIEGVQTIAPVLGFWAFAVLLEEESERRPPNLAHVPELVDTMRAAGFDVVSPMPLRQLDRIRASALHPTPKDPLPGSDEVHWFREAAGAYLRWRAAGRP